MASDRQVGVPLYTDDPVATGKKAKWLRFFSRLACRLYGHDWSVALYQSKQSAPYRYYRASCINCHTVAVACELRDPPQRRFLQWFVEAPKSFGKRVHFPPTWESVNATTEENADRGEFDRA